MKYIVWTLDSQTKVPKKHLETDDMLEFQGCVNNLIVLDIMFAARYEK